mmetsp:Transcript_48900/g.122468  ORF Transcript_48900/g.122468 Transcript_48900/m.122468 type:complete len:322 (+) Transcript_48900:1967-2932(+)
MAALSLATISSKLPVLVTNAFLRSSSASRCMSLCSSCFSRSSCSFFSENSLSCWALSLACFSRAAARRAASFSCSCSSCRDRSLLTVSSISAILRLCSSSSWLFSASVVALAVLTLSSTSSLTRCFSTSCAALALTSSSSFCALSTSFIVPESVSFVSCLCFSLSSCISSLNLSSACFIITMAAAFCRRAVSSLTAPPPSPTLPRANTSLLMACSSRFWASSFSRTSCLSTACSLLSRCCLAACSAVSRWRRCSSFCLSCTCCFIRSSSILSACRAICDRHCVIMRSRSASFVSSSSRPYPSSSLNIPEATCRPIERWMRP